MTTETIHRNHPKILAALDERLQKLVHEPGEVALTMRIIVRDGVPRKVKFTSEDDLCLTPTI